MIVVIMKIQNKYSYYWSKNKKYNNNLSNRNNYRNMKNLLNML